MVFESLGEGSDTVASSVHFSLGAGASIETLRTYDRNGTTDVNLTGNEFAQTISGNAGSNVLSGLGGNDYLVGDAGNDDLAGGDGADTLRGGTGSDILRGGAGNDLLYGDVGADQMAGGTGDDTYIVDSGADTVTELAGEGQDSLVSSIDYVLAAGAGIETLRTNYRQGTAGIDLTGNEFAQTISGNAGSNTLSGGGGIDRLIGDAGNDVLIGGDGADILQGGAGADSFSFNSASDGVDNIRDYSVADDTVVLDQSGFLGLTGTGTLSADAFRLGTAAQDADDHIIFDSVSGRVYYDADGNGAGAQVLFAQVTAGLALTNADFLIAG